ncbi:MAG: polysaccharide biosynthesis/export family protein, partial [Geminicoccaceae bacterium]
LETEIEKRLKDGGYLVNPQVGIQVLNYRPFYIIGEVTNPGSYQYVNGMTVINAVALAGGFTYRADEDDIIINRGGSEGPELEALLDTEVLPGDIINVTERFF